MAGKGKAKNGSKRKADGETQGKKVDPRMPSFHEFLECLPNTISKDEVQAVFGVRMANVKACLGVLDKLVRCLQSFKPSTRRSSYIALVILLTKNKHVKTQDVISAIKGALVTDGDNTRGERRIVYGARILALGAVIRSHRLPTVHYKAVNEIFNELVSLSQKKTSLLILAAPFICDVLRIIKGKQKKHLEVGLLQELLNSCEKKQQTAPRLKISLASSNFKIPVKSPLLESVETICDAVVGFVKYEDKECLQLLFQYLVTNKQSKAFWKDFASKFGPYHFDLLQALILQGLKCGCPLKHILRVGFMQSLVGTFTSGDNQMIKKVKEVFRHILDWGQLSKLSEKDRTAAIKLLFGTFKLSAEYRWLNPVFRRFLTFLSPPELDLLYNICKPEMNLESSAGIPTLTFIATLPSFSKTSVETKLNIVQDLLHTGFCPINTDGKDVSPEVLSMRKRIGREGFESALKSTYQTEFIKNIFSYVKSLATGRVDGRSLEKPASEEDLANLKTVSKLMKKMDDEDLCNVLRIYWIYSVVDSNHANRGLDTLIPLCEKTLSLSRLEKAPEIMGFIATVIQEEKLIFKYESVFTRLLMDRAVGSDSVQALLDIIDIEMAQAGDDESEGEDEEELPLESPIKNGENGVFMKTDDEIIQSDEESLDMDAASDTELEKMDAALANVFSTKKRVKGVQRLEEIVTIRVLNLIGMLLSRYNTPEDGAIPLMIVIPSLTILIKTSKSRKNQEIQSRVTVVVRKLNSLKKIMNAHTFKKSLVRGVFADVEAMLKKKLPKRVRSLIRGTLEMLKRRFPKQLGTKEAVVTPRKDVVTKRKKNPLDTVPSKKFRKE